MHASSSGPNQGVEDEDAYLFIPELPKPRAETIVSAVIDIQINKIIIHYHLNM